MKSTCFETLSWQDAADIALQRTSTLIKFPIIGAPSERAWFKGLKWPLNMEAKLRKNQIFTDAYKEIQSDFNQLKPFLPKSITNCVDIGCGHAFLDLLLYQEYQCNIHLVDIEENDLTHFDFHQDAAAYASLAQAKSFLMSNGIDHDNIQLTNPNKSKLKLEPIDLAVSLYSCGFHYPIQTYLDQVYDALSPGGVFIFDLRKDTGQLNLVKEKGSFKVIDEYLKHSRLALLKPSQ